MNRILMKMMMDMATLGDNEMINCDLRAARAAYLGEKG
jgi:hypothetical protein